MPALTALRLSSSIKHLWFPAGLYLILSLTCTQIPLLHSLGYEFSFVTAIAASLIGGLTMVHLLPAREVSGFSRSEALQRFVSLTTLNAALLLIPLVVVVTNALFVRSCSMIEGIGFFLLLPVVTVWFASAAAFTCSVLFRHARAAYLVFLTITLFYAAGLGYFTPAIHSYNFFYGYFPGATYDDLIEINLTLVLFRSVTAITGWLILQVGLLTIESAPSDMTWSGKLKTIVLALTSRHRKLATAGAVLFCAGVYLFRCPLGFESTAGFIRHELGNVLATDHFDIYYPDSVFTADELDWMAKEHEFRLQQVLSAFSLTKSGRIESYVYKSPESKRRYIGTGTTSIAKPWSGQLHTHSGALGSVLKHELVHIVAAPFGVPVIRASLYPGLTEGMAMAVEWDWGNRTLHEYAAGLRQYGAMPDMERIMGSFGFVTESSSVAYVLAGSFCRYLMETYGIRQLTRVYRTGSFEDVYGRTLPELVGSWESMLETVGLDEGAQDAADLFFSRPSIFRRECPRAIARRLRDARKEYGRKNYASASEMFLQSYHEGRSSEALGGYLQSELRLGNTGAVISAMDTIILRQEFPARMLPQFLPVGDAYWLTGNTAKAREVFARIICADFSNGYTEASLIRSSVLEDSAAGALVRSYLLEDDPDSVRIRFLDTLLTRNTSHPVGLLLRGRLHARTGDWENCAADLSRIASGSLGTRLESARLKVLGIGYLHLGKYGDARAAFMKSAENHSTPGAVVEIDDWLERTEVMERDTRTAGRDVVSRRGEMNDETTAL